MKEITQNITGGYFKELQLFLTLNDDGHIIKVNRNRIQSSGITRDHEATPRSCTSSQGVCQTPVIMPELTILIWKTQ